MKRTSCSDAHVRQFRFEVEDLFGVPLGDSRVRFEQHEHVPYERSVGESLVLRFREHVEVPSKKVQLWLIDLKQRKA